MEQIAAAAIRINGTVFTGPHHHQIFRYLRAMKHSDPVSEQGFITNTNRFVNRFEAGKIAFEAKQMTYLTECLFSEDLWSVHDNVFLGKGPSK